MKVLLAAHGYPPELVGGTELSVARLAHALVRAGHDVVVVAGSIEAAKTPRVTSDVDRDAGHAIPVFRIHRADLYFDHWQKSLSTRAGRIFAEILERERPAVVHVHHWIRLSRDLVHLAAAAGVPAVVSLHDFWTTCLITFRVRPDTQAACDAQIAAHPCLACAAKIPPRTPWVPIEAQHIALAERQRDLMRELALARAVTVPSRTHAELVRKYLAGDFRDLDPVVIPPASMLASTARETGRSAASNLDGPRTLGRLVLASFGSLSRLKGTDLLLDAVRRVAREIPVELHLAGAIADPRFEAELVDRAAGLDVRFHGAYAARDLALHPARTAHAFVSASRAPESYGLVVDEARALGLPCVLPELGAFPERAAASGGCLLFRPGDAEDLAATLLRLAREPELFRRLRAEIDASGTEAARRASSPEDVAPWIAIYERAVALGAPDVGGGAEPWFRARMREFAESEWDKSFSLASAEELGL